LCDRIKAFDGFCHLISPGVDLLQVFVARQPIFDRQLHVYAYELLFRQGFGNVYDGLSGDSATSAVLTNSFLLIGLDTLTNGKRAFVNFTQNLLLKQVPTTFPKEQIAVEVLETVEATPEVIMACHSLKNAGYLLALDDFVLQPGYAPLIRMADIIKVDFLQTEPDERAYIIKEIGGSKATKHIQFLAEKVETQEDYQMAMDLGYSYVQGYFFSKPVVVAGQDIPGFKLNNLQVLFEVNQPNVNLERLEKIIRSDVSLSYKLLRYVNSAYFGLRHKVESIRHALALLGENEVRKWASLVALGNMGQDKPQELVVLCAVRAKFCEFLAYQVGLGHRSPELYLMGLFSLVDAFFDQPKSDILQNLPIADDIKDALSGKDGQLRRIYELVVAYEEANWDKVLELTRKTGVADKDAPILYRRAVNWADNVFFQ
jgi:EAL and modified HD-GYP domain-containing signal transduction protein